MSATKESQGQESKTSSSSKTSSASKAKKLLEQLKSLATSQSSQAAGSTGGLIGQQNIGGMLGQPTTGQYINFPTQQVNTPIWQPTPITTTVFPPTQVDPYGGTPNVADILQRILVDLGEIRDRLDAIEKRGS